MNETIVKFGYPASLVAQYRHWIVLLRPDQPTLGSLVLAGTGEERRFSDLPAGAFAELGEAVGDIERALEATVRPQKLNYLMLMMVDPHVHWHVVPRYEGRREAFGLGIDDSGWPKMPQLGDAVKLTPEQIAQLGEWLRANWPGA
jgi:diadenosine tetraphosphate (Ap4A) HIT family hydrolase